MAKGPASDTIMTPDRMKPLLALSKREPVQAAIGLTTEGEGLVLLDKKAKPKKVLSLLRGAAAKAKLQLNSASLRFGRAEVDTDYDSGMVRFFINKDAPGNMRIKLVEVVKRIPYQKVEINVDPALEEESEEDETAVEQTASAPVTTEAPPIPPPTTEPPAADDTELRHLLAAQAKRIPEAAGADAGRRAALLKIAAIANDQLKSRDLAAAGTTIEKLRQVIESALGGGTRTTQGGGQGGQAMAGWQMARSAALQSLKSLETAVRNFKDARSDEAVILLRAIQANLTAEPSTPAQVNELVSYLRSDRIITDAEAPNGFGIKVELRAPLLGALAALEREQATAGVAA